MALLHDLLGEAQHLGGSLGVQCRGVLVQKKELGVGDWAMGTASACLWLPGNRPTLDSMRVSGPRSSSSRRTGYSAFSSLVMPQARVRLWPRRRARARFSSICMSGAVPHMGSWNTRSRYLHERAHRRLRRGSQRDGPLRRPLASKEKVEPGEGEAMTHLLDL